MLKALMRVRLEALKSWFLGGGRNKSKPSAGKMLGFAVLMLYSLGALGFMFWHYFSVMYEVFVPLGLEWLYYSFVSVAMFALMFVGTVFFAKAQLYEAKDNELLLSMPIKPVHILVSRLFMLTVISVFFSLPVLVSAMLVAWTQSPPGLYKVLAFAAEYLIILLLSQSISALFGWLLSVVTARVRRKTLMSVLMCIIFIGAYSYFVAKLNTMLLELVTHAESIAGWVGAVTPLYWLGSAVALKKGGQLAILGMAALLIFALCFTVLCLTFTRTATDKRGSARVRYVEKRAKTASPEAALLRRELARFGSSSAYIMNAALGLIMMLAAAVMLIVKRGDINGMLSLMPGADELTAPVAAVALLFLCSMNMVSAPSVSLEGSSIWLVQSLPVSTEAVLKAKLKMHVYLCVPPVLAFCVSSAAVLKIGAVSFALMTAAGILYTVFVGVLGLVENLHHPNLNWTQEAQAVKSGMGVLFTMLIGWGSLSIPVGAYLLWGDTLGFEALCGGFVLVLAAVTVLLYRWLMSRGCAIFRSL